MDFLSLPEERQAAIEDAESRPGSRWNPGWGEAWWWLWLPVIITISMIVIFRTNEPFYRAWVLPEGFGMLELSQFIFASAGFVIAVRLLFSTYVRGWPLLKASVFFFALACLYIAGEEHSWGQHFFHWQTPEYWSEINRQNETNLHNTFEAANHLPQFLLELGIWIGGIALPLWQKFAGPFRHGLLKLFVPSAVLMPTALSAAVFKIAKKVGSDDAALDLVTRPSEALETFFYLFILYYLIIFARRISALETSAPLYAKSSGKKPEG